MEGAVGTKVIGTIRQPRRSKECQNFSSEKPAHENLTMSTKPTLETCAGLYKAACDRIDAAQAEVDREKQGLLRVCDLARSHGYEIFQIQRAIATQPPAAK